MEKVVYRPGGTIYTRHNQTRPHDLVDRLKEQGVVVINPSDQELWVEGSHQGIRDVVAENHTTISYWPNNEPSWSL